MCVQTAAVRGRCLPYSSRPVAATVARWPKILQKSQKGPNLKNILHNFWPKVVETGLKKLDHVSCFFRGSRDKKSTFKNVPF